jgi:metal-dependent amidase/aminoacylase/carboxypeptidase family protein
MAIIAESIAAAYGAKVKVRYMRRYPAVVNSEAETETAAHVLAEMVGEANVRRDLLPSMGGEDFAFLLQKKPGTYIWIGNGENREFLHHPRYDFNDEILPLGATYWARLVETVLAKAA